jgi:hypothetical protein
VIEWRRGGSVLLSRLSKCDEAMKRLLGGFSDTVIDLTERARSIEILGISFQLQTICFISRSDSLPPPKMASEISVREDHSRI